MLTVTCSQTHRAHSPLPATGLNRASVHWRVWGSPSDCIDSVHWSHLSYSGRDGLFLSEHICFNRPGCAFWNFLCHWSHGLFPPDPALVHGLRGLSGVVNGLVFEHLDTSCRDASAFAAPEGAWRDPAVQGSTHSLRVSFPKGSRHTETGRRRLLRHFPSIHSQGGQGEAVLAGQVLC